MQTCDMPVCYISDSRILRPLFRRVNLWHGFERKALHPNCVSVVFLRSPAAACMSFEALKGPASHGLRAGFITEAYKPVRGTRRS